jgi:hypothetical protein
MFYDAVKNKFYISNQVRFNEQVYPMSSEEAIAQHAESSLSDILVYQTRGIWVPYDRGAPSNLYSSVTNRLKYDRVTDELILRRTDKDNTVVPPNPNIFEGYVNQTICNGRQDCSGQREGMGCTYYI